MPAAATPLRPIHKLLVANRSEIAGRKQVSAHRQSAKMGVIRVLKWLS